MKKQYYAGCLPCAKGSYHSSLESVHRWQEEHWKTCPQTARFPIPAAAKARDHGITPNEKYAQLEADGEERPVCECHDEPMRWKRRADYKAGGRWVCRRLLSDTFAGRV